MGKISRTKISIKAEVSLCGFSCELKIRVYRKSLQQYSVEVQRRRGDGFAFNRLFSLPSQHLTSCSNCQDIGSPETMLIHEPDTTRLVPEFIVDSRASVEPLLDLIENSQDPALHAEALQGLAQATQDAALAVQLCAPQVLMLLQRLTETLCFTTVQPFSQVLVSLAAVLPKQHLPDVESL